MVLQDGAAMWTCKGTTPVRDTEIEKKYPLGPLDKHRYLADEWKKISPQTSLH
jgi:hypothetical protein